jgi:hypothetical protein
LRYTLARARDLRTKPCIAKAIAKRQSILERKIEFTVEKYHQILARHAEGDMTDYAEWGPGHGTFYESDGVRRTDLEGSAWLVQPMGVGRGRLGRSRQRDDQAQEQPQRVPESAAATGAGRNTRRNLGLDDEGPQRD